MSNRTEELTCIDVEDIDESTRSYINEYKEKKNRVCKWVNYKHGDQICLEAILEIVEMPPSLKSSFHVGEASRLNNKNIAPLDYVYYVTSPDPREEFKNLLISNVPFKKIGEVFLFNKWELINWMEREREADSNFMYTLPPSFINYCRKRKLLSSYLELLEENKELNQIKGALEKEIKRLQKKESVARNSSKKKVFIVKLANQIKKDMDQKRVAIDGIIITAILMFLDLKANAYGLIVDSDGKEVKGLSVSSLRKVLIEENLMSTTNKVGKKSKKMSDKEKAVLQTIKELFKKNQYKKLCKEAEEIKKLLKYKK